MIAKIKEFLNTLGDCAVTESGDGHAEAIVSLLCEVCNADHCISEEELAAIERTLCKLLSIKKDDAKALLAIGKERITTSNSLFDFTSQLSHLDNPTRIKLIASMWEVAYSDNHLDPIEESIIRKVAGLIYVEHHEFIRTKLAAMP